MSFFSGKFNRHNFSETALGCLHISVAGEQIRWSQRLPPGV
jgi:hypothetical protein